MGIGAFGGASKLQIRRIQTKVHGDYADSDDSMEIESYSPALNGFLDVKQGNTIPARRPSRRKSRVTIQEPTGINFARPEYVKVSTEDKSVGNGGVDGFLGLLNNFSKNVGKQNELSLSKKLQTTPELQNLVLVILKELQNEEIELQNKLFSIRNRINRVKSLLDQSPAKTLTFEQLNHKNKDFNTSLDMFTQLAANKKSTNNFNQQQDSNTQTLNSIKQAPPKFNFDSLNVLSKLSKEPSSQPEDQQEQKIDQYSPLVSRTQFSKNQIASNAGGELVSNQSNQHNKPGQGLLGEGEQGSSRTLVRPVYRMTTPQPSDAVNNNEKSTDLDTLKGSLLERKIRNDGVIQLLKMMKNEKMFKPQEQNGDEMSVYLQDQQLENRTDNKSRPSIKQKKRKVKTVGKRRKSLGANFSVMQYPPGFVNQMHMFNPSQNHSGYLIPNIQNPQFGLYNNMPPNAHQSFHLHPPQYNNLLNQGHYVYPHPPLLLQPQQQQNQIGQRGLGNLEKKNNSGVDYIQNRIHPSADSNGFNSLQDNYVALTHKQLDQNRNPQKGSASLLQKNRVQSRSRSNGILSDSKPKNKNKIADKEESVNKSGKNISSPYENKKRPSFRFKTIRSNQSEKNSQIRDIKPASILEDQDKVNLDRNKSKIRENRRKIQMTSEHYKQSGGTKTKSLLGDTIINFKEDKIKNPNKLQIGRNQNGQVVVLNDKVFPKNGVEDLKKYRVDSKSTRLNDRGNRNNTNTAMWTLRNPQKNRINLSKTTHHFQDRSTQFKVPGLNLHKNGFEDFSDSFD